MSASRTKRHNNIDKDGETCGLPGVWGSPLPYNSDRKSGAVLQPQPPPSSPRAARTLTSVLHKLKTAVRLRPSMHRGTAGQIPSELGGKAEVFACCYRKLHVFTGCAVGLLNAQLSSLIDLFLISKRFVKYLCPTFCTKTRWHKGRWSVRWDGKKSVSVMRSIEVQL